jgi:tetratricopeptide (TPR) repeat protein
MSLIDNEVMDHLLTLLAHLPLAITQAAAYINKNQISLMEYLQLFENIGRDRIELLSAEFQDNMRYEQTQDPVATTWFISFNQIRKADELAWRILMFLAYIEPKAVPQSILPDGESRQQLTQAIGTLCGYRFLDRRGSSEVFDMHSLVHLAIWSWVAENDSERKQRQTTISHLKKVFPTDDWKNRDLWRQYLPHVIKLLSRSEDDWSGDLCEIGCWAGRCLLMDGRATEAVQLLERVVAVEKMALAENHLSRLASEHALAGAYQANGQVTEAVRLLEHVVAVEKTILAENHLSRLASEHALAGAYQANGQVTEAIGLLEHVVAVREATLAENHPDRLASQHELARIYKDDNQTKKAVELLERVVAFREATSAENHPDRLASQHELARIYKDDNQTKKAVELLEHVVTVREKVLAEHHPSRLASQHSLAIAYRANGQIKKAVELLEHVVAVEAGILAEDHPDRLASEHALAGVYQADGQIKKAIKLLEHVVAVDGMTLAADHPYRLASERELTIAYETSGWTGDDTEDLASEASDFSWSNSEGSTHPSTLSSGPSVTRYQTAENHRPISFLRYKKPEADHESGKRDDDIQSIASVSDDVSSLAESKYDKMVDIRHAAMAYFVSTLTGIPGLLSLYERAAKVMSEAKFVRNHRRLLKLYYLGLHAEGKNPSQRFAVQFLRPRSNRIQISLQICHLVTPSESTVREHVTALLKQEKDNFIMLDRFLGETSFTAWQAPSNHAGHASYADSARKYDENSGSDSDTGSELDDNLDERYGTQFEENDVLSALERTKEFFINGEPFRVYQDRMHEFLNHAQVATELKGNYWPSPSVRDLRSLKAAARAQIIGDGKTSKKVTVSAWWLWLMNKWYPPPAGYSRISYICVSFYISFVYYQ